MELRDLVGKELVGFFIEERTEVYELDCEGRSVVRTVGVFKKEEVAKAYCSQQTNSSYFKTGKILVLVNGANVFSLENSKKLEVFDDESNLIKIRSSILAKLTPEERKLIGM